MKITALNKAALAFAASGMAATAVPANALEYYSAAPARYSSAVPAEDIVYHSDRHRRHHDRRYHDRRYENRYYGRASYGQPVYRDTRIWRGRDGHYYCRKQDGSTGLLIGAAVGGLLGNQIAERGDRTLGTLLGAVGGAILGREIDRSNARCR